MLHILANNHKRTTPNSTRRKQTQKKLSSRQSHTHTQTHTHSHTHTHTHTLTHTLTRTLKQTYTHTDIYSNIELQTFLIPYNKTSQMPSDQGHFSNPPISPPFAGPGELHPHQRLSVRVCP